MHHKTNKLLIDERTAFAENAFTSSFFLLTIMSMSTKTFLKMYSRESFDDFLGTLLYQNVKRLLAAFNFCKTRFRNTLLSHAQWDFLSFHRSGIGFADRLQRIPRPRTYFYGQHTANRHD